MKKIIHCTGCDVKAWSHTFKPRKRTNRAFTTLRSSKGLKKWFVQTYGRRSFCQRKKHSHTTSHSWDVISFRQTDGHTKRQSSRNRSMWALKELNLKWGCGLVHSNQKKQQTNHLPFCVQVIDSKVVGANLWVKLFPPSNNAKSYVPFLRSHRPQTDRQMHIQTEFKTPFDVGTKRQQTCHERMVLYIQSKEKDKQSVHHFAFK